MNVNRVVWTARIIGILMLIGFMMLFANLRRRLADMQGTQPAATATEPSR